MSEQVKVKVLVGIPSGARNVETAAFLHWITLIQHWGADGVAVIGTSDGPTALLREFLTRKFIEEKEYTHLLMLDTDHAHPVDIIQRLSRWLDNEARPLVVSGLNYQRKSPYRPCAFMFDGPDLGILPITRWPSGLVRVDAVGAASLLVAREVFERIPAPWWEFVYHGPHKKLIGEDIWFCARCREAGIDIYVDTTTTSPHLGEQWIADPQFRGWMAANGESLGPEKEIDTQGVSLPAKQEEVLVNV
jgi:hypothetical protein